jgi:hypothetical protein
MRVVSCDSGQSKVPLTLATYGAQVHMLHLGPAPTKP